jgi:uncharacterized membrane protein
MKLAITIRWLSGIQIFLYVMAMQTIYASSQDGIDSMDDLEAIFPLALFALLGVASAVVWIVYIVRSWRRKRPMDITSIILTIVVISLAFFYSPIVQWALDGPG